LKFDKFIHQSRLKTELKSKRIRFEYNNVFQHETFVPIVHCQGESFFDPRPRKETTPLLFIFIQMKKIIIIVL